MSFSSEGEFDNEKADFDMIQGFQACFKAEHRRQLCLSSLKS